MKCTDEQRVKSPVGVDLGVDMALAALQCGVIAPL